MAAKEATARIKINRLLDEAGWRFFADADGPANIVLEPNTKITESQIDALGEDFETTKNGFIDFLLLDRDGRPLIVLEAKSEGKNPLSAKEQARRYAREQNARFVILSNGNIHYLWDLKQGNPSVISKFPSPDAIKDHHAFQPDAERLASEVVERDYIALTQMPVTRTRRRGRMKPNSPFSSKRTSCASCATIRSAPFAPFSVMPRRAQFASCSRWQPAPARR